MTLIDGRVQTGIASGTARKIAFHARALTAVTTIPAAFCDIIHRVTPAIGMIAGIVAIRWIGCRRGHQATLAVIIDIGIQTHIAPRAADPILGPTCALAAITAVPAARRDIVTGITLAILKPSRLGACRCFYRRLDASETIAKASMELR